MENLPPNTPAGHSDHFENDPGPNAGATRPQKLRDPGSMGMTALSWLAIICVVSIIVISNNFVVGGGAPATAQTAPSSTSGIFKLMGRYAVGAVEVAKMSPAQEQVDMATDQMLEQLEGMAASRDDQLRLALVAANFDRSETALEQLDLATSAPEEPDVIDETAVTPEVPEYVFKDAARIRTLIESGSEALTDEDAAALRDHHGWFAEVALTSNLEDNDPAREAVIAPAMRVLYLVLGLATVALIAVIIGFVILIVLFVRLMGGKLRVRYAPPAPGGSVYLETFALFLLGFIGMASVADYLPSIAVEILRWSLLLILFWPLVRGASPTQLKYALGWHRGEGVMKELGAGIVGYLAGLPIVALSVLLTLVLSAITAPAEGPAAPPSHPIVQSVGGASLWTVISLYLLASVWAPLTEESMFRGALFHHLRGTFGAVFSALLVGFIFAVIHPQGILLVPPLMALGFNFAMMREWRGSLIAPMFAHGVHNAILVTALIVAMS